MADFLQNAAHHSAVPISGLSLSCVSAAAGGAAITPSLLRALPAELLALYESAQSLPLAQFETSAARQLGRLVGFDGAVWGIGACHARTGQLEIAHARALDRPACLLANYAAVAGSDPVTAAFEREPSRLQAIVVQRHYQEPATRAMRDYLHDYEVRHLLLQGLPYRDKQSHSPSARVSWITAYRAEAQRPFDASASAAFQALLPHWLCARHLCESVHASSAAAPHANALSVQLTAREHQVLELVAKGCTSIDVAALLGVSVSTVRTHSQHLYDKLGAHNKTEAVFEARQLGLLA